MENIDIIAPNLSGKGGTETVLKLLFGSHLLKDNFKFNLLLVDRPKNREWLNTMNDEVIIKENDKSSRIWWIIKNLITTKSKMLIILGPRLIFLAWITRKIFKKKYKIVSWIHFTLLHQKFMKVSYLKYADYHLAISSQMIAQFEKLGINKKKVFVIYNPVVIPQNINHRFRKETKDLTINICYIGRVMLNGQKNLKLLFDSLKKLTLTETKMIVLDIWGDGEIKEVKKYIESLNFKKKFVVHWHGWVNDPWEKVSNVDLLILTSIFEGFGMVLTEAISRGVPVVSTDYPVGARDIIIPGLNGELTNFDSESVKNAILKVLNYPLNKDSEIKNSVNKFEAGAYSKNLCKVLLKILRG